MIALNVSRRRTSASWMKSNDVKSRSFVGSSELKLPDVPPSRSLG